MNKRFVKFIFVGILNTIVGYGSYSILVFLGLHYLFANTLSTIFGIITSYILNRKITFSDKKINIKTPIKFISVYAVSYLFGMLNLFILIDCIYINSYIAGFLNLILTTLISWFGHNKFSFN